MISMSGSGDRWGPLGDRWGIVKNPSRILETNSLIIVYCLNIKEYMLVLRDKESQILNVV